jgi:membrane peptidoglycan carboxypeptidase
MIRAPVAHDPFRHPRAALARRATVLARLERHGHLRPAGWCGAPAPPPAPSPRSAGGSGSGVNPGSCPVPTTTTATTRAGRATATTGR